jgi:hypothetical protein
MQVVEIRTDQSFGEGQGSGTLAADTFGALFRQLRATYKIQPYFPACFRVGRPKSRALIS